MKQIVISLINYKNHQVTKECLQSLEKLQTPQLELIVRVVNNDTETDFVYKWKGKGVCEIINHRQNLGFSGGHNINLSWAIEQKIDYILVLNNDTIVDADLLRELITAAKEHATGGIFAPKIYFAKGHEFHHDRYTENERGMVIWYAGGTIDWDNVILSHRGVDEVDKGQFDKVEETSFASGCCMLVRREALEKAGLFDEKYFLYYEDSDLNERVKRAGFSVFFIPKAKLWHVNAGSTGGSGSKLQDYFITRNRLLFGTRFAPFRSRFALFRESLSLLLSGREWQKKGVVDYYLGRFGKGRMKL